MKNRTFADRSPGEERTVIFLDVDGVLNSPDTKDKIGHIKGVAEKHILLLREIRDYLNADIVLISSWKDYWNQDLINDGVNNWRGRSKLRYGRYLNLRLGEYGLVIADKTEEVEHWRYRAKEVINYLNAHPEIKSFVILDDEDFQWGKYGLGRYWIETDYREGLLPEHVEMVKNLFPGEREIN